MEAISLAEIGNKAKVPIISLFDHSSLPSSNKYPFLVHSTQDETSQFKGIVALVEAFNWEDVTLIYGDSDFERDVVSYMIDSLQDGNVHITSKCVITASDTDEKIIKELYKLMSLQTTVFIVHISQAPLSKLLINAKNLGMMSKGYAWFMSATTMNLLHFADDYSVFQSMQGVVGLKSYVPASKDLDNLSSRLRRKFYIEYPNMEVIESSTYGIWAYDSIWALAEAVERTKVKVPRRSTSTKLKIRLNLLDFDTSKFTNYGSILLKEMSQTRMRGLSGEFVFENGRRMSSGTFEIVNVIGKGERRVGLWSAKESTEYPHRERNLLTTNNLEAILWPGGTTTLPKGRLMKRMNGIKLKIGVPMKTGFKELVRVDYDLHSNATHVTGFCIDVFRAAIELLPYQVEYQFMPFVNSSGLSAGTYNDLVHQVYLQVLAVFKQSRYNCLT